MHLVVAWQCLSVPNSVAVARWAKLNANSTTLISEVRMIFVRSYGDKQAHLVRRRRMDHGTHANLVLYCEINHLLAHAEVLRGAT